MDVPALPAPATPPIGKDDRKKPSTLTAHPITPPLSASPAPEAEMEQPLSPPPSPPPPSFSSDYEKDTDQEKTKAPGGGIWNISFADIVKRRGTDQDEEGDDTREETDQDNQNRTDDESTTTGTEPSAPGGFSYADATKKNISSGDSSSPENINTRTPDFGVNKPFKLPLKTPTFDPANESDDFRTPSATRELAPISLEPNEFGENIGDIPHQTAAHQQHPERRNNVEEDFATKELAEVDLTPGEFGENIGDSWHQIAAHIQQPKQQGPTEKDAATKELAEVDLVPGEFGENIGDSQHQMAAHQQHPQRRDHVDKDAATKELAEVDLKPGEFGENIGDSWHQVAAHQRHPKQLGHIKEDAETKELAAVDLKPSEIGENIGDSQHQQSKAHQPRRSVQKQTPEMCELDGVKLKPGEIGENIGDRQHQQLAHEEEEHNKHSRVRRASASGPFSASRPSNASSSEQHHTRRRSSAAELGLEPNLHPKDLGTGQGLQGPKDGKDTAANDTLQGYLQRFLGDEVRTPIGKPDSQLLEGTTAVPGRDANQEFFEGIRAGLEFDADGGRAQSQSHSGVMRRRKREHEGEISRETVTELLKSRDKTIKELQETLEALGRRIQTLEATNSGNPQSTVAHFSAHSNKADSTTLIQYLLYTSVLLAVAALGGWIGTTVERGEVGMRVAEWLWKQGRGV